MNDQHDWSQSTMSTTAKLASTFNALVFVALGILTGILSGMFLYQLVHQLNEIVGVL